ncbi:RnfH family protein [Endozoicomonas sp. Mp262]|uniref:RnfH family protein n=1 Tax=Endozoicomonas sp. Mp262 TaxID=2919499 RepID=UPI0021D7FB97
MADQEELRLTVEVAYAKPFEQKILSVKVAKGTTVYDAVRLSGIVNLFPEINLETAKLGIFGKAVPKPQERELKAGDRVEIYRPLIADPKEARRKRAEKARLNKLG